MELEHFYFGRDGEPLELFAWAEQYEDFEGRLVATDMVGETKVVTVWLGTNDEFDHPPLIYGTLAWPRTEEGMCEIRTSTQAEAEIAHRVMVDRVRSGAGAFPWPPWPGHLIPQIRRHTEEGTTPC